MYGTRKDLPKSLLLTSGGVFRSILVSKAYKQARRVLSLI